MAETIATEDGISPVSKVVAGALIPALATILFNALSFLLDHRSENPLPPLPDSVWDFGVGCAFSLVGIAVATRDIKLARLLPLVFVGLLMLILGGQLAVEFFHLSKFAVICTTDFLCGLALCWAIVEAG